MILKAMKCYVLGAVVLLISGLGARVYAQDYQAVFFSGLQDVPLMSSLVEMPDQALEFDKPQGRVIESVAEMRGVEQGAVMAFYNQSLPQFGWVQQGVDSYVRGEEKLVFSFEKIEGHHFVRITLTPR